MRSQFSPASFSRFSTVRFLDLAQTRGGAHGIVFYEAMQDHRDLLDWESDVSTERLLNGILKSLSALLALVTLNARPMLSGFHGSLPACGALQDLDHNW